VGLEQALSDLEQQLESVAVTAKKALAALKKAQASAKVGHLRALQNQLADSRNAARLFVDEIDRADQSWKFDAEAFIAGGDFLKELILEADRLGLRLIERDGRVFCPPMMISVSPRDAAIYIDRKIERKIRPAVLAKVLAGRQKKPQRLNIQRFLDTLFHAYTLLASRVRSDWTAETAGPGPVIELQDIYDLLTILPGTERDYARDEFARDIAFLDEHPDLKTKDGRRFALPASTGSKIGGKRLTVIDREGTERTYVGILFEGK